VLIAPPRPVVEADKPVAFEPEAQPIG
jgi:hypothetical protein